MTNVELLAIIIAIVRLTIQVSQFRFTSARVDKKRLRVVSGYPEAFG